jgi:hypothetical protein
LRTSIAVLLAFTAACAPQLDGVCTVDADCGRTDEVCSGGICLRRGAGNSGPIAVELTSPAAGAQVSRAFRVAARVTGEAALADVTFIVANSANGAQLGQLAVNSGAAGIWSGAVTLDASVFGGAASVRAVAHRSGQADVVSSAVPVVIDQNAPAIAAAWSEEWYARDAGLSLAVTISDDRSGVAAAELQLPDGGVYSATLGGSAAVFHVPASDVGAPGAVTVLPVSLSVTDVAGNRASVEGKALRVDDEPPAVALVPVSSAGWFGGALDVAATAGDGAGSGVASTQLLIDGRLAADGTSSASGWSFQADLAHLLPETEGVVALQVVATDVAGNAGSAGQLIQVDTVAPAISAAQVVSGADGRDAAGQDWFRGPTAAPGAGDIVVSAAIVDQNLVSTGVAAPAAIAGGARYPGTADAGRWTFAVPRSVGLNATGPVAVTFDAQDLAGNHPVASPSLALYFDDVSAQAFKPVIAADSTWYARSATVRPNVAITFPALPRSGIAAVILRGAGQTDSSCMKSGGSAYLCTVSSTSAPAAAETALAFEVIATSASGVASASSGSRNIDDAPPVVSSAAPVPYPPPGGPPSWSHDGSHFNVRDAGVLYAFTAYDCGSGVRSVSAFSLAPSPATRSVTLTDSGARQACPNGAVATVYDVALSANLSTLPAGTFPAADNMLNLNVTVVDGASDGGAGVVRHPASQAKAVAVTRRLWQTAPAGISRLALGPLLVASSSGTVSGLARGDGATVWSRSQGNVLAPPVVGGLPGAPVVYFATGSASVPGAALNQVSAQDGSFVGSACLVLAAPFPTCQGGFRTHSASLAVATDGTPVLADNFYVDTGVNGEADCWSAAYAVSRGCSSWIPSTLNHNLDGLFIGRQGRAFFIDAQVSAFTGPQTRTLQERPLGGAGPVNGPGCGSIDLLTDAGGADAPVCNGARYTFSGSASWPSIWTGSASPTRTLPALDLFFAGDGAAYSLANGSAIPGFNGAGSPLLIDGSSPPVLYSAAGPTLSALRISAGGYGPTAFGLPSIPGSTIDDALLDRAGTLYVASNGQVSAIAVDSPGPAGGMAWPTRNRDSCRSNNLEFACPF